MQSNMSKKRSIRSKKSTKTKKSSRKVDKNMRGGAQMGPTSNYNGLIQQLEINKDLLNKTKAEGKPISETIMNKINDLMLMLKGTKKE